MCMCCVCVCVKGVCVFVKSVVSVMNPISWQSLAQCGLLYLQNVQMLFCSEKIKEKNIKPKITFQIKRET